MCLINHTKHFIYLYLRFPVFPEVFIIRGMILLILVIKEYFSPGVYQHFSDAFIMNRYITTTLMS